VSLLIVVAALLALGGALVLYLGLERAGPGGVPLAVLRAVAWAGVAALLVDPGCRHGTVPPTVLLDGSRSMEDVGGDARWRAAEDSARRLAAGGPVVVFGGTPVAWRPGARPTAATSLLLPALREAASRGGPVVIVTDGEVDDATALPADVMRAARIVVLPRPRLPDAALAGVRLPAVLAAGDTASAEVDVVGSGATPRDSATVELREEGRVVGRRRVGLAAGSVRATVRFVPAPPSGDRALRRYQALVTGWRRDADPRDDAAATAAAVSRTPAVVLVSESPDWDFRRLTEVLRSARATPVRSFVRVAEGPWRDATTLAQVREDAVRAALLRADLVVAHGPEVAVRDAIRLAPRSTWTWVTGPGAASGDWYVTPEPSASPVGAVLSGVAADSLPPLAAVRPAPKDSTAWTAVRARAGRRGVAQPVLVGGTRDGRHWVEVLGSGLWRWGAKGGVAAEAYRSVVLGLADWLLERGAPDDAGVQALRDSLSRGASERLPRPPVLAPQAGTAVGAAERVPLQQRPWVYGAILVALSLEWIARRRRGMR
jgi:hypothetical protein